LRRDLGSPVKRSQSFPIGAGLALVVLAGAAKLVLAAAPRAVPASPQASSTSKPAGPASAGAKPLTAKAVRALLLDLHRSLFLLQRKGHSEANRAMAGAVPPGTCYGGPARPFMKAADVLPTLEARVTGKALPCFVASYFGCRLGDWLAEAEVADEALAYSTYDKSKVTIVEQRPDRVVAEVVESESGDLSDGKIDYGRVGGFGSENLVTNRYELTRDSKGKWLVSDRKVAFKGWECRPN
jgi:hypothetical protein